MAECVPRTLRIEIEVIDNGGVEDYNAILRALSSIGAEIIDETEV